MDSLLRVDPAPVLEFSVASLAQMSNMELLEVIHSLEFRESGPQRIEYDHRKYLQRHELERIINLLQWLRRRQSTAAPFSARPAPAASMPINRLPVETQTH